MFEFIKQYIKDPKNIGAVAPSGKGLAKKMMEPIYFDKAKYIVEYGPGTGSFTTELVKRKAPETKLILIERNKAFYQKMKEAYGDRRDILVIHGDASRVNEYLKRLHILEVDYVISGLPFTSLPREISDAILTATIKAIGAKGRFITFQYTLMKRKLFETYFTICGLLHEIKNLPPAYVLVMKNKSEI